MAENLTEIGVGGALAVIIIGMVLKFAKFLLSRKETSIDSMRKEMHEMVETMGDHVRRDLVPLHRDLKAVADDAARFLAQLMVMAEQIRRIDNRDIPALRLDIQRIERRLAYLENSVTEVRSRGGLPSGQTPPLGVPTEIDD